jgi:hypothetical protein
MCQGPNVSESATVLRRREKAGVVRRASPIAAARANDMAAPSDPVLPAEPGLDAVALLRWSGDRCVFNDELPRSTTRARARHRRR